MTSQGSEITIKVAYKPDVRDVASRWARARCPHDVRIVKLVLGASVARITLAGGESGIQSFIAQIRNQKAVTSVEEPKRNGRRK